MLISQIIQFIEKFAPPAYQESYDNCGLIIGNNNWGCTGVLCTLDATEAVIEEAKSKNCNLVVAHHPIVFSGLKKLNGKNYVERAVISAIKNDIAIYAIHTNLDNVQNGVNATIAEKLGLKNCNILLPKQNLLCKLYLFVPPTHATQVRDAIFNAGAGHIANYSECSFNTQGTGTFKGNETTNPFSGTPGTRSEEAEVKIEVILPVYLQQYVVGKMIAAHPYEEVAYDIIPLSNRYQQVGSGLIGELNEEMNEGALLDLLKRQFNLSVIKHTPLLQKPVKKIAVCGGAGSFLIKNAIAAEADVYISSDIKYHEFFDAEDKIVVADIGHWESEQFTIDLLMQLVKTNSPTFAVLKSEINTNPVQYFL